MPKFVYMYTINNFLQLHIIFIIWLFCKIIDIHSYITSNVINLIFFVLSIIHCNTHCTHKTSQIFLQVHIYTLWCIPILMYLCTLRFSYFLSILLLITFITDFVMYPCCSRFWFSFKCFWEIIFSRPRECVIYLCVLVHYVFFQFLPTYTVQSSSVWFAFSLHLIVDIECVHNLYNIQTFLKTFDEFSYTCI